MGFHRYTLGVAAFVASAGLASLGMLTSLIMQGGTSLGSITIVAIFILLSAGLMLRKRHFRWICGLVSVLMAIGVFLGSVVPSLTSVVRTDSVGTFVSAMALMLLMTIVPLVASYFLLLDSAFSREYRKPKTRKPVFDAAFKAYWIALLAFVVIVMGFDVARLFAVH